MFISNVCGFNLAEIDINQVMLNRMINNAGECSQEVSYKCHAIEPKLEKNIPVFFLHERNNIQDISYFGVYQCTTMHHGFHRHFSHRLMPTTSGLPKYSTSKPSEGPETTTNLWNQSINHSPLNIKHCLNRSYVGSSLDPALVSKGGVEHLGYTPIIIRTLTMGTMR